jgi:hypothetical protein
MSGIILAPGETNAARIVSAIRQLVAGRSNAAGRVTLAANAASTTVAAPNCAAGSEIFLFARSANAAAEVKNGTIYVLASDVANKSFKITHANNAETDRIFSYVAIG